MGQPICYVEFGASDVPKAARFYKTVFGWEFTDETSIPYSTFSSGDGLSRGIYKVETVKPGGSVVIYVLVEDIGAALHEITKQGGSEAVARTEIPGTGWYGHFTDPFGNLLGLFTPKTAG